MALIRQLGVQIEPLHEPVLERQIWRIGCGALDDLVRLSPGDLKDVQSIRCILSMTDHGRTEMTKHLVGEKEIDKTANPGQGRGSGSGDASMDKAIFYTNQFIDSAVKWNALWIAGAVEKNCRGFVRMYWAMWMGRDGKVDLGIIICKNSMRLDETIQANKLKGVALQAELEVDLSKGTVREIDRKSTSYCYDGALKFSYRWVQVE
jgi:hypothetical protein